jgi:hypothetical protein
MSHDPDLALCGAGACARPPLRDLLDLSSAHILSSVHTPRADFFAQCKRRISIFYYKNYFYHVQGKKLVWEVLSSTTRG